MSTPSLTMSTDTSQRSDEAAKRSMPSDAPGSSEVTTGGRRPVIRDSRSARALGRRRADSWRGSSVSNSAVRLRPSETHSISPP
jgi:hypothetical protein